MPMISGPGGVPLNAPTGGGLLSAFDPDYQAQLLQNQASALALKRATAFQGGVPTTDGTPNGPIDFDAIARRQIQDGDVSGGAGLLMQGLKLSLLRDPSTVANPTGQGSAAPGSAAPAGSPVTAPANTTTAAPGDYLSRLAQVESGGNDNAPASGSSAFGRYRFTDSTWKGLAQEYPQLGLTPDGRSDFGQQQRAVMALTNNNVSALGRAGYQPTPGNLRLAHFAGAAGATAVLGADPSTPVSSLLGARAVKANPFLDGMTAGGLVGWADKQMAGVDPSTVPGSPNGMPSDAASALVRLGSGQGTEADRATFRSYQASRAGGGSPAGALAGPASPTAGGSADGQLPGPSGAPIGDAEVMRARGLIQATSGYAPESLAPEVQRAVAAAKAKVAQYLQQQNTPAGATPAGAGPATGGSAPASAPAAGPLAGFMRVLSSGQPVSADQAGMARGFLGAVQRADPAVLTPDHQSAAVAASQVVSRFDGQGGGAGVTVHGAPAPEGIAPLTSVHPYAAAAPGTPLPTNGPNPAAATGGVAAPGMAPGLQPAGLSAPTAAARSPYGAPPAALGGPDLPYLQGAYARPGGGPQYVTDLLDTARRYALAGEQQAAATYETRAKQVQDDLMAVNKARLDLATHNAELSDQEKHYRDAQAQGFRGTPLEYLNAIAAGKANARAAGSAAYDFVQTQPVPGGPTVYRSKADIAAASGDGGAPVVQSQPAYFGQRQSALGKLDGEMQGQFQQRQVAQERLDALSGLQETFQSGAGAEAKAAAVAAVRAAGFDIPNTATANPEAVEQYVKNSVANIFANAKDMGGRVLVTELEGLAKANANPNMQPGANAAILAQQKGLLNWEDQHYVDYSAWRRTNPYATDASAFETAWAKANPVGAYVTAARRDIAPLGAPLPAPGQWVDGQAYMVNGQKVRWDAASGRTVPFSGTTAPALPGQARGGRPAGGPGQPAASPPVAGARQARDGNWYVADPNRPGKFLMVAR